MATSVDAEEGKKKVKSGSQKRRMSRSVKVALTESERKALEAKAANAGLSLSAFGRACLLGEAGPRARRAPCVNRALLAEAVAALNRVGNNLNQVAHHMNAGGHPDRAKVKGTLEDIGACFQIILDAMGRAQ